MTLKNKVAIITGAGRGIGEAIALELASKKVNLALIARKVESLKKVATKCESYGIKVSVFPFDLTQIQKIPALVADIQKDFPVIDILVNNAGTYVDGNLDAEKLSDWDYALDLNFRSVYHLTNQTLPMFRSEGGSIINVSSIAGNTTYKGGEIYSATKHALKAYSNCLFDSVREKGIKVTCLFPGFVNTDMGRGEKLDSTKMIQPEDIANAVLWAAEAPLTACPTEITIRPQFSPYR